MGKTMQWFVGMVLGGLALGQPLRAWSGDVEKSFSPKWKIGDRWLVDTWYTHADERDRQDEPEWIGPLRLVHEVFGREVEGDREAITIGIRPVGDTSRQWTRVRLDRDSDGRLGVARVQAQYLLRSQLVRLTRDYREGGEPRPVLTDLSALPYDFPVFPVICPESGERTQSHHRREVVGGVTFATKLSQSVQMPDMSRATGLQPRAEFVDDGTVQIEIRESGDGRRVVQLWTPGLPWPVASRTGASRSRLVAVEGGRR